MVRVFDNLLCGLRVSLRVLRVEMIFNAEAAEIYEENSERNKFCATPEFSFSPRFAFYVGFGVFRLRFRKRTIRNS